jgi:hypothetical protein
MAAFLIDYINKKARLIVNAHWRGSVPALWFYVTETGTQTASVEENL